MSSDYTQYTALLANTNRTLAK